MSKVLPTAVIRPKSLVKLLLLAAEVSFELQLAYSLRPHSLLTHRKMVAKLKLPNSKHHSAVKVPKINMNFTFGAFTVICGPLRELIKSINFLNSLITSQTIFQSEALFYKYC